jgi:lipoate-protein ligase A
VEALSVRLLPFAEAGGPQNMAADEALLQTAAAGVASLRFYGWAEATVSLGYFQRERLRREDPRLAYLPHVRRPSGGAMLVHHHEVTYALGLPAALAGPVSPSWLRRMHQSVAAALWELGVEVSAHARDSEPVATGPLCFRHLTAGDLLVGAAKVVGSAQRRHRGALLQHGAILLSRSPHTPSLPGIRELTGRSLAVPEVCEAVLRSFQSQTGWRIVPSRWTEAEQRLAQLLQTKYSQASWNARR